MYIKESFYHVYNRGVEKRNIFLDEQDYSVFLSYLQTYLSPKDEDTLKSIIASPETLPKEKDNALKLLHLKNYSKDIELICYALLPNHFHLLLRQHDSVLNHFMNSLGTRYGMYFNRKYRRQGVLFQDVYKAVGVETEEQLLHLSRYIHRNPTNWLNLPASAWRQAPYPCSISEYIGERKTDWIKPKYILDYFSKNHSQNSYEMFLEISDGQEGIDRLIIEDDINELS